MKNKIIKCSWCRGVLIEGRAKAQKGWTYACSTYCGIKLNLIPKPIAPIQRSKRIGPSHQDDKTHETKEEGIHGAI